MNLDSLNYAERLFVEAIAKLNREGSATTIGNIAEYGNVPLPQAHNIMAAMLHNGVLEYSEGQYQLSIETVIQIADAQPSKDDLQIHDAGDDDSPPVIGLSDVMTKDPCPACGMG